MSGGHFDYMQHRLHDLALVLDDLSLPSNPHLHSKPAQDITGMCADMLHLLSELVHELDYAICGDSSEDDLPVRVRAIMTTLAQGRQLSMTEQVLVGLVAAVLERGTEDE